jgi:DNA (cytosine-5)-methyltransferase 1
MLLNEIDSFAAEWLENLIAAGLIPPATVDTRSIADLSGSDCHETTHFFAGIDAFAAEWLRNLVAAEHLPDLNV